jgi:hypothetical protein
MGKGKADFARALNEELRPESVQHYIASALEFRGTVGRFTCQSPTSYLDTHIL